MYCLRTRYQKGQSACWPFRSIVDSFPYTAADSCRMLAGACSPGTSLSREQRAMTVACVLAIYRRAESKDLSTLSVWCKCAETDMDSWALRRVSMGLFHVRRNLAYFPLLASSADVCAWCTLRRRTTAPAPEAGCDTAGPIWKHKYAHQLELFQKVGNFLFNQILHPISSHEDLENKCIRLAVAWEKAQQVQGILNFCLCLFAQRSLQISHDMHRV